MTMTMIAGTKETNRSTVPPPPPVFLELTAAAADPIPSLLPKTMMMMMRWRGRKRRKRRKRKSFFWFNCYMVMMIKNRLKWSSTLREWRNGECRSNCSGAISRIMGLSWDIGWDKRMHLRRGKYPNIQLDDPDASQISFDASRTPIDLGVTNGKNGSRTWDQIGCVLVN